MRSFAVTVALFSVLPSPSAPLRRPFPSFSTRVLLRRAASRDPKDAAEDSPEAFVNLWEEDDDLFTGMDLSDLEVDDTSDAAASSPLLDASRQEEAELERLDKLSERYRAMKERGMSDEQVAAYLGPDAVSKLQVDDDAVLTELGPGGAAFQQTVGIMDLERTDLLGVAPSHQLVEMDEDGEPALARFVYVDEYSCIGCTHCASHAPETFFMEDGFGRARVFQQAGDAESVVATAVSLCPVDCIHYVGWEELQRLEKERATFTEINYKGRLVGSSDIGQGFQEISGNQSPRCNNCPTQGCYDCPMYGVGFNPTYIEKRKNMARRKSEKKVQALRELSGDENLGRSGTDL